MSEQKNWLAVSALVGFFITVIDQIAKWWAYHHPLSTGYLLNPWLGWELFLNPGVAFGLPIPNWFLVFITPLFIAWLLLQIHKRVFLPKTTRAELTGLVLILFGALSNYSDRVLVAATIDYFRIFYSVINIADILIITGLGILFSKEREH